MDNFNEIRTRNELADFIEVPRKKLTYVLYVKKIENLYKSFNISKKSGGYRQINAPQNDLKQIQKKLEVALYNYERQLAQEKGVNLNISHAFKKGKSFITNARIHRNKRLVINVDLENFFDSFHFGRVRGYFMKNRNYQLSEEVATTISQIVCFNGKLPQGAPTSPVITNMICNIFDMRLLRLAKKYKLDYTRYADDLSFSTNARSFLAVQKQFFEELSVEIVRAGFSINDKKTKIQYKDSHQEVTGIVVNKKLNVDRKYYKETRAMADRLYKTGEYTIDGENKGTINQLEGRLSFINQLDKYNNKMEMTKHRFENLKGREKTYSKFLAYKYFFNNEKPVVITEGKTDVLYLKAAMKKLWKEYPKLIDKRDKRQVEYRISFLKRSKRIEYFLNIKVDGADALNNILEFYNGKNPKYPNYIDEFKKMSGKNPTNPVILLFDNELIEKDSPISKFSRKWLKSTQEEELRKENWINIQDNLYVMLTPLIDGLKMTDIEMLFDEELQNIEIDGRTLDKTGEKDKSKYFNKDFFSKYIMKNYDSINFENFKFILNDIEKIIMLYKNEMEDFVDR